MKHIQIELGQYDVKGGDWLTRYIIHKIMLKTVDVSIIDRHRDGWEKAHRAYRYPKNILLDQINYFSNAEFLPRVNL